MDQELSWSLRKTPRFHLISQWKNFVETQCFRWVSGNFRNSAEAVSFQKHFIPGNLVNMVFTEVKTFLSPAYNLTKQRNLYQNKHIVSVFWSLIFGSVLKTPYDDIYVYIK